LLALKSLLKSIKIDANNATLHEQLVRFALAVQKAGSSLKPAVKSVIDKHWDTLFQGMASKDLKAFTSGFLETSKTLGSVPHLISAAIAVSLIEPGTEKSKAEAEALIFSIAEEKYTGTRSLENVLVAQKTLKSLRSSRLQEFKSKAALWFPKATVFQS
jgi:peptide alpha-N-acetyltransferase